MARKPESAEDAYLVAGCKPWSRRVYDEVLCKLPGRWRYVGSPEEFSQARLGEFAPRYIFFLHWSWKVPQEIVENFECVCFHMTDVPYGRGGSPLQNLIVRGHRETMLTALRMSADFDAGPVYLRQPLSLEGNAEEVYMRATELSAKMIERITREHPAPEPQHGEVVNFKRRKPEESEIGRPSSLQELHDFIRMLDAEGYPHAFLNYGGFRFEFTRAALYEGRIVADVRVTSTAETKGTDG
ncbi:MAG: methionyl-tRNA formyltransferase [Acidobacteriia bacterium]|nr:methionyl-tRNA formyltransferase [Terriglobia bacterium]